MLISPEDYNLVIEVPDPGFSPDRNRTVIEGVIKHNLELVKRKKRDMRDRIEERADYTASFYSFRMNGGEKTLEDYFGGDRQFRARMYAEKFVDQLRRRELEATKPGDNGLILL